MSVYKQTEERRQYYRIDDSAIFSYRSVDSGKQQQPVSTAFEMIELFSQMNRQMSSTLGRISEHAPDISSYLKGMDNKIDLLAQMCFFKESQSGLEPNREINLGAGGLAFGTDEKLKQGTMLAMDMILSTDLLCLHLTGRVIQVAKQTEGNYSFRVSVGFTNITDLEVDQIIKHIMRMQSEQLRAQRI